MAKELGFSIKIEGTDAQAKALGELTKNLEAVSKERKALQDQEKKALKTGKDSLKLTEEQTKELGQLITQERELRANKNELNKEIKNNNDLYAQQSKRLNELRKEYKNLVLQEGKATKETKDLQKQIQKLDKELKDVDASVGQFQRNVGNYPKVVDIAARSIVGLAVAIEGASQAADGFRNALDSTEEGSKELAVATSQLEAGLNLTKNLAATAALDLVDFGKSLFSGEKSLTDITDAFEKTSNQASRFGEDLTNVTESAKLAAEQNFELERSQLALLTQIEILNGVVARQNVLAGDNTRSFNEIEEAAIKALNAEKELTSIRVQILEEELAVIDKRLASATETSNQLALQRERTEKLNEILAVKNDLSVTELEIEKQLRETKRDRFERELDFAIDAFDAQKTVNERIIADDRFTLERRKKAFEELTILSESAYENQIRLIQEYTGKEIDIRGLAAEQDEEIIRKRLKQYELDDTTLGRILETIRERKFVLQDVIDAQNDLNDATAEERKTRREDLDALKVFRAERKAQLSGELSDKIDALKTAADAELRNEELTANQKKLIQEKYYADLEDLVNEDFENKKKKRDEEIALIEERNRLLLNAAIDLAGDVSDALFDAANSRFEREQERIREENEIKKEIQLTAIQDEADTENLVLQSKLEKGLITEQQFEQQKADIDANKRKQQEKAEKAALEKEIQLQREAFERKKRVDTAQAIVNGALAFTSILATSPDILKPIGPLFTAQAAIAAASTATQVALIQSQKFARGGLIQGESHANGGVPFSVNGVGGFEAEGGEAIINKRSTAMFRDLLSDINAAGGGVKFARGGLVSSPSPSSNVPTQLDTTSIAQQAAAIANTIRVENVATETASVNSDVISVENLASA